ncbi:endo-1,4-beta-xylanase [Streptomyces sp. NPDC059378]|uniref:endo-1,4-beta-xylanase n=1 Tax=Streptomyces sp. NPDC059378 TaxID=3346815 RepID=UPI0036833D0B
MHWDVVDEAFNEGGTLRESFWLRAPGPGYIEDAFRWAHQADPHAKLFYNDYNIEWAGPKSDAVLGLVRTLCAEKVPVQGSTRGRRTLSKARAPPTSRTSTTRPSRHVEPSRPFSLVTHDLLRCVSASALRLDRFRPCAYGCPQGDGVL